MKDLKNIVNKYRVGLVTKAECLGELDKEQRSTRSATYRAIVQGYIDLVSR